MHELINQWAQSVRANFELRCFLFGHQHKKTLSYNILDNPARDILLYSPRKKYTFFDVHETLRERKKYEKTLQFNSNF
jgi:hypothetical protein